MHCGKKFTAACARAGEFCKENKSWKMLMSNYENALATEVPRQRNESVAEVVEGCAASVPSSAYLGAAFGALALALACHAAGRSRWGCFIAQWAPAWLLIGAYRKVAKLEARRHAANRGYTS
jgi:hypothetical protein